MKIAVWMMAVLVSGGLFAQAGNQNIPYVDLEQARTQVTALQQEVDTLTTENETLSKQTADLRADIVKNQQQISEIGPIQDNVKAKGAELFSIIPTISDRNLRKSAQESLERNRELERRLETRRQELVQKAQESQRLITANDRQVSVNNSKIQRNKDQIVILNAAISKTENQQRQLNSYMESVDSFLSNSEKVLGPNTAAPSTP